MDEGDWTDRSHLRLSESLPSPLITLHPSPDGHQPLAESTQNSGRKMTNWEASPRASPERREDEPERLESPNISPIRRLMDTPPTQMDTPKSSCPRTPPSRTDGKRRRPSYAIPRRFKLSRTESEMGDVQRETLPIEGKSIGTNTQGTFVCCQCDHASPPLHVLVTQELDRIFHEVVEKLHQ